jgi:hypothetical protein
MMGSLDGEQEQLFYSFSLEDLVPKEHLLRGIDRFQPTVCVRAPSVGRHSKLRSVFHIFLSTRIQRRGEKALFWFADLSRAFAFFLPNFLNLCTRTGSLSQPFGSALDQHGSVRKRPYPLDEIWGFMPCRTRYRPTGGVKHGQTIESAPCARSCVAAWQ